MIPIAKPWLDDEEINAVVEVLKSGMLAQGSKVKAFEGAFSEYIGVKHAIAVANGTLALDLTLKCAGIKAGDEVITSPFTFIASANSILYQDARPVFVDIERDTFNIDPAQIEEKITEKTKAIMPVHIYGHPADMKPILEIAEKHGLKVIEDSCQAHGAEIEGKKAGSFGLAATFSFYATKNMTCGEGGMITTDSEEIAEKARLLRDHGQSGKYLHVSLGYNYRMTDIAASIGLVQLKKVDRFNSKRIENANYLSKELEPIEHLNTPKVKQGFKHVYHLYAVEVEKGYPLPRDQLIERLRTAGIGASQGYLCPIYEQPLYRDFGIVGKCPVAEEIIPKLIHLPIHPLVSEEDLRLMTETFRSIG